MKFRIGSILVLAMAAASLGACSSDDSASSCSFPTGTYDVTSVNYRGETGLCVTLAAALNKSPSNRGSVTTITKVDDTTFEVKDSDEAAPTTFKLDPSSCTLTSTQTTTVDGVDTAGKAVKLELSATKTLTSSGTDTISFSAQGEVSSPTSGAQGVPCTLTASSAGTRRK